MRVNITTNEIEKHFNFHVLDNPNFEEIIVNYIQDNYFNGADSAVIYIGYNETLGTLEFDLIPG